MGTIIRELEALERLHEEFGFRYLELAQALNRAAQAIHHSQADLDRAYLEFAERVGSRRRCT